VELGDGRDRGAADAGSAGHFGQLRGFGDLRGLIGSVVSALVLVGDRPLNPDPAEPRAC